MSEFDSASSCEHRARMIATKGQEALVDELVSALEEAMSWDWKTGSVPGGIACKCIAPLLAHAKMKTHIKERTND